MADAVRRYLMLVAASLAAVVVAVIASSGAGASFNGSSGCVTLPATAALESTLLRVHRAEMAAGTKTTGPFGRVYYGRCPKAYYALATFHHKTPQVDFGAQDQPERLRRRVGGTWQDRGDTGGFVCEAAPKALLKLWNLLEGCD